MLHTGDLYLRILQRCAESFVLTLKVIGSRASFPLG
jgi:hypothetical protein